MNWFKNRKIRTKLVISFLLVAFITGIVGFVGITKLKQADDSDTILYEKNAIPVELVGNISTAFLRQRTDLLQLIITKDANFILDREQKLRDRDKEIETNMTELEKLLLADEEKTLFNNLSGDFAEYQSLRAQAVQMARQKMNDEGLAYFNNELDKVRYKVQDDITKLSNRKIQQAKQRSDQNTVEANSATLTMEILVGIGVVVALILGFWLANFFSKTIKHVVSGMDSLSNIDLPNLGSGCEQLYVFK